MDLGSGGGSCGSYTGGAGGGMITIKALEILNIDGYWWCITNDYVDCTNFPLTLDY
jgi:hypothetical protein